jgi:hypothetical protein
MLIYHPHSYQNDETLDQRQYHFLELFAEEDLEDILQLMVPYCLLLQEYQWRASSSLLQLNRKRKKDR